MAAFKIAYGAEAGNCHQRAQHEAKQNGFQLLLALPRRRTGQPDRNGDLLEVANLKYQVLRHAKRQREIKFRVKAPFAPLGLGQSVTCGLCSPAAGLVALVEGDGVHIGDGDVKRPVWGVFRPANHAQFDPKRVLGGQGKLAQGGLCCELGVCCPCIANVCVRAGVKPSLNVV